MKTTKKSDIDKINHSNFVIHLRFQEVFLFVLELIFLDFPCFETLFIQFDWDNEKFRSVINFLNKSSFLKLFKLKGLIRCGGKGNAND